MTLERQIQREEKSREIGVQRYQQALEQRGHADTPVGERVIGKMVSDVSESIQAWLSADGRATRGGTVGHLLVDVDPDALALLTLRASLKTCTRRVAYGSTCVTLGGYVEEHIGWTRALKSDEKAYFNQVGLGLRKATTERHRRNVVRHVLRKKGIQTAWTDSQKAKVGSVLLHCMLKATEHFTTVVTGKAAHRKKFLVAAPALVDHLRDAHTHAALLSPFYSPMVVPPRPWTTTDDGGYETLKVTLMKSYAPGQKERMTLKHMPKVYTAINRLQATPWRINKGIYDLMREAWQNNWKIGGLPEQEPMPLPAQGWTGEPTEQQLTEWKRKASKVHEENARLISKRLSMSSKLHQAADLMDDEFYYVYSMDWRGRVYPMGADITPQSDDTGRALLEFAHGKTIGMAGMYWLGVHLANCFGHDKCSLHDRVSWALENDDAIQAAALEPFLEDWWAEADKPWCFLAACMEWTLARQLGPENHVTHLPINVDGSCNGLQHFAAMLRDEPSAAAVNLKPGKAPSDVYQMVADRVIDRLETDVTTDNDMAHWWLRRRDDIDRKLVKRPVMTVGYGVTMYGIRDQLANEMRKRHGIADWMPPCKYLSELVYEAIGDVVAAAREAMDWLHLLAQEAGKVEAPIQWTTPVGLPVVQDYRYYGSQDVEAWAGAQRLRVRIATVTERQHKRKQQSGISPNFVHSMDAAHMMLTVLAAKSIKSFAMVHDSFGTLACDVDYLNSCLREAFVQVYSGNALKELRDEATRDWPDHLEVPTLPEQGEFDIESVRESEYFFA